MVKKDDHLMDAMRYWWMSGRKRAIAFHLKQSEDVLERLRLGGSGNSGQGNWMR